METLFFSFWSLSPQGNHDQKFTIQKIYFYSLKFIRTVGYGQMNKIYQPLASIAKSSFSRSINGYLFFTLTLSLWGHFA